MLNPTDEQASRSRRLPRRRPPGPAGRRGHRQDHHAGPARPRHPAPRPLPRLQPGHRPGRRRPLPANRRLQDRPRPRLRRRRPPLHPPPERPPPPGLADRTGPRHHQSHPHRRPRPVTNETLSYATLRTVARFCHTADHDDHPPPRPAPARPGRAAPCTPQLAAHIVSVRPQSLDRPAAPRRRRRPLRPRPLPENLGPHRARKSTPTSSSSTRPRTPTPSSSRSSSPNATTPSWSWSATPPRPSTTGAAPKTS